MHLIHQSGSNVVHDGVPAIKADVRASASHILLRDTDSIFQRTASEDRYSPCGAFGFSTVAISLFLHPPLQLSSLSLRGIIPVVLMPFVYIGLL